jgi:hypothetical protein
MPLSAYVKGVYCYGPSINRQLWLALKRDPLRSVALPCGRPGFLRTSKLGTQHFVHLRRHPDCAWANESAEHVEVKRAIIDALAESGWEVRAEQSGPDWRADVLATSPTGRRIAFEVQLSPQTFEETVTREDRFREAGVEGVWLFRRQPSAAETRASGTRPGIPMFALRQEDDGRWGVHLRDVPRPELLPEWTSPSDQVGVGRMALTDFVRAWLDDDTPWRPTREYGDTWTSAISIIESPCRACRMQHALHAVHVPQVTACGIMFTEYRPPSRVAHAIYAHLFAYGPYGIRTLAAVDSLLAARNAAAGALEPPLLAAKIISRNHGEVRFACPHCGDVIEAIELAARLRAGAVIHEQPWPIPNPESFLYDTPDHRPEAHYCLASPDRRCPRTPAPQGPRRMRNGELPIDSPGYGADWPVSRVAVAVRKAAIREGWSDVSEDPTRYFWHSDIAYVRLALKGREVGVGITTGAAWTVAAVEQVFVDAEASGVGCIWIVPPGVHWSSPSLARAMIIPLRVELGARGDAQCRVQLARDEEVALQYALGPLLELAARASAPSP